MRVVVTEASSPVAYHLLQLMCSGDVLGCQAAIDLVLCDQEPVLEEVRGVAMEIQDCVFPIVSSVSVSSDFFDAVRSADVAVILQRPSCGRRGARKVEITHSTLPRIDFQGLDASIRMVGNDDETRTTNGALATAVTIATHIQGVVQNQTQTRAMDKALVPTHSGLYANPWYKTQEPAIYTAIDTAVKNGNQHHSDSSHYFCLDEDTRNQMGDNTMEVEGPIFERLASEWENHQVLLVHAQETYLGDSENKAVDTRQNNHTIANQFYISRL